MKRCAWWIAAFAIAATACSGASTTAGSGDGGTGTGGDGGGGGGGGGKLGSTCSTSSPCENGLTCAQSGDLLDRCTADCSMDTTVCARYTANSVCMGLAQCALVCSSGAGCPDQGECVPLSSGNSACVTNPDGPPGASAPANGACWNVGGPFGDTIPNGGYRCTPSTSATLGTTVDQCNSGMWKKATYTCTCMSGGFPSNCFDIMSQGSAQCSYAVTACAQCIPGSGCQ